MIFPGEVQAVKVVLAMAEAYGYGNLISHLRRAWALKLMAGNPGLDYEAAVRAANTDAYREGWSIEAMANELGIR